MLFHRLFQRKNYNSKLLYKRLLFLNENKLLKKEKKSNKK